MARRAMSVATSMAGAAIALMLVAPLPLLAGAPPTAAERDRIRVLIVAEARDMGFSAALALAVAHAESFFDPAAESHKGARCDDRHLQFGCYRSEQRVVETGGRIVLVRSPRKRTCLRARGGGQESRGRDA